jgi:hypothetical protein
MKELVNALRVLRMAAVRDATAQTRISVHSLHPRFPEHWQSFCVVTNHFRKGSERLSPLLKLRLRTLLDRDHALHPRRPIGMRLRSFS